MCYAAMWLQRDMNIKDELVILLDFNFMTIFTVSFTTNFSIAVR